MNMKIAILMAMSVLLLTMSSASATYYYTNEYFKENFGKALPPSPVQGIQHDVVMYTDSDAFYDRFGNSPAGMPSRGETPLRPERPVAPEEPKLLIVAEDAAEDVPVIVVPLELPEEITVPIVEETAEEPEDVAEAPEDVAEEPGEAAQETLIAPAAVSEEGGIPIQIAVIGLLIVVIVVMLTILLTSKEKPKKDDWAEGDFLKKNGKKADNKVVSIKAGPKLESSKNSKRDVKPFLLKIKEEI